MSIGDKWFLKSKNSFESGKEYQGIKEFNVALDRAIENAQFERITNYFDEIIHILDSKELYHEIDKISQNYFIHLKKKKLLVKGVEPFYSVIVSLIRENSYSLGTFHAMKALLAFISHVNDPELVEFCNDNYSLLIDQAINFEYLEDLLFEIFTCFIYLKKFDTALEISDPTFFDSLENVKQLSYAMYGVLVLAIQNDITDAVKKLQYFRKTISKDLQSSEIFKCCSEFILVSSSTDEGWLNELKSHFTNIIKENDILKILIGKLIEKYFPELKKSSIFDLFSQMI